VGGGGGGGGGGQEAGHRHGRLLRARRERPRRHRAAEKRDELAAVHSMTPSARASSLSGKVRPSAFAVLRLTISSSLAGCSTGKSAGRGAGRNIFPEAGARGEMGGPDRTLGGKPALR